MKSKRFFAFGCSFTRYAWPTWADIIGAPYEENYYNYGKVGAGNIYIHNTIMEVDQIHKFNSDDLVIVQWSGVDREDRYLNGEWRTKGNVLSAYSEKWISQYYDSRGYLIRDIALIKSIKEFLEYKKCKYEFISMAPIKSAAAIIDDAHENKVYSETDDDVYELYKDVFDIFKPSFFDTLGPYSNRPYYVRPGVKTLDSHRLPFENYEYLKQALPEYLNSNTELLVKNFQKQLAENWDPDNMTWYHDWNIVGRNAKKKL